MTGGPVDRGALAMEHAMGLLDGAEAAEARRLETSDPAFGAAVADWRTRLAGLDATAAPVTPSADLWSRIEATLDRAPARTAAPAGPATGRRRRALWSNLAVWRAATATAAAAALALLVWTAVPRPAPTPVLVAILLTDGDRPGALVNVLPDGSTYLVPLAAIPVPAGRALQVWTLWDRAVGPRPVGLLDRAASTRLRLDDLPLGPDQLFEITLEPAGGSPTGRPTGPILMKGTTARSL